MDAWRPWASPWAAGSVSRVVATGNDIRPGRVAHGRRRDLHSGPCSAPSTATRYVTPLREGGSLPALVEADDDGLYVVKLLGAGHGRKALVAELVAGELARHLGLPVPDQVLVELDGALSKAEPDGEIQDLLERRRGPTSGSTSCPGRWRSRRRSGRRPTRTWRRPSSGSTRSRRTSTGRRATPT